MGLVSGIAVFVIIWWVVLFTTLPMGVRSQAEEENITLGTDPGAPNNPRLLRKILLTTAISVVVFGLFYVATVVLGFGMDDIPRIVPRYQRPLG